LRLILWVTAVTVVLLDQATKFWVVDAMPGRDDVELLGGLLTLTYVRNPGAAFSFGPGLTVVFTAIAIVVALVIVRSSRSLGSTAWALALGGLLGGAVGNLIDRLARAPGIGRGEVVDWLQLSFFWPVFNLADVAISCSAVTMVVLSVRGIGIDGRREGDVDTSEPPDAS
jgi:signal peptidase II